MVRIDAARHSSPKRRSAESRWKRAMRVGARQKTELRLSRGAAGATREAQVIEQAHAADTRGRHARCDAQRERANLRGVFSRWQAACQRSGQRWHGALQVQKTLPSRFAALVQLMCDVLLTERLWHGLGKCGGRHSYRFADAQHSGAPLEPGAMSTRWC
jgi:hypothetical protein